MSVLSEAQLTIRVDSIEEFESVDYNNSNSTVRTQVWEFNFVEDEEIVQYKIRKAEEKLNAGN